MEAIDLIMLSSEYIEHKEGVVITFSNGKMAKQKNLQYMMLHGLLSDGLKEHKLVSKILNEEIDDVLSFIPVDATEERDFINELTEVMVSHVNKTATYCFDTFNKEFDGDRKAFVMKFKKDNHFHYMTRLFNENSYENIEEAVIKDVIFKCRKLEIARAYVKDLGFERELTFVD
jgi:hypothetical protein